MFIMCPSVHGNSEAGACIVTLSRETDIHGSFRGLDLTAFCKSSGKGPYPYTLPPFCFTHTACIKMEHFSFVSSCLLLRVIALTRLPSALLELSEPLQVSRYEHGDFTNAHYDSSSSQSETTCAHTRLAGNTSALTEVSCRYAAARISDLESRNAGCII